MTEKLCTKCGRGPADGARFHRCKKAADGLHWRCTDCVAEQAKKDRKNRRASAADELRAWKARNPARVVVHTRRQRDQTRAMRDQIIDHYGALCVCCGEDEREFLTVEHIGGVPERHRRPDGKRLTPRGVYLRIIEDGFPSYIEILCWNCNCARGIYGYCPHERGQLRLRLVEGGAA